MKIRNGFVSNSSSTSFVIAYKECDPCKHCGRSDLNIIDLIKNSDDGNGDTSVDASGYKNVINDIDWLDSDDYDNICIEMDKLKSEGYEFARISISHSDYTLESILHNQEKAGSLKILYGD
jgi:hypothetical protein